MPCPTLMIQGTGSDAGKSLLVTALCHALRRGGVAVAPFKPQNMALNSAVTADGGEIGRAQAVQAQAAGIAPHTDMNPVLLKPTGEMGAQVIVHGRAVANLSARDYHAYKPQAMQAVLASYRRLGGQYQAVLVEGAGSPAEINLREGDIANMGFAEAVDCPVILVGDIDRGGVFAQLAGTLALLSDSERERVKGLVINKFRGDVALLQPGLDWLEQHTGKPVLGVLPYLRGLYLEAEDGINPLAADKSAEGERLRVLVPALPRLSNHTDFDPLRLHPQVDLQFLREGQAWPAVDLVILPGSKNVREDLHWLRQQGWDAALQRHLRYGGKLIGICGGLQMLGTAIHDPHGVEGPPGSAPGLGWLELETTLQPEKQLRNLSGVFLPSGAAVQGYEIHAGTSSGPALLHPALRLDDGRGDGAISQDGQILATYMHGLFEQNTADLLRWAGLSSAQEHHHGELRLAMFARLADCVEQHLDMPAIRRLLGAPGGAGVPPARFANQRCFPSAGAAYTKAVSSADADEERAGRPRSQGPK